MRIKFNIAQLYLPLIFLTIDSTQASEECSRIIEDQARLACYDKTYEKIKIKEIEQPKNLIIKKEIEEVITQSEEQEKPIEISKIKNIFSIDKKTTNKAKVVITTYEITKVQLMPNGKYVIFSNDLKFKLNDYVKRSFKPKVGTDIQVYESKFGGYRLKFDGFNREYKIKR
ncbi:hypothetical protein N9K04_03985 [Gammaproteobacteria bacterium]|nr:hypothetical protein [Gammaproteobacteria bacterium]